MARPGIELAYGDVADAGSLRAATEGVSAVVHLVAIIRERGASTFERVNHRGTENVASAAQAAGARCLVYLSVIGVADDLRLPYLRSKWLAEQAVRQSGVPHTILRASLLFGEGDEFFNVLAGVVKAFPLVPVAGNGRARFQPLAVEDVAECVAQAVEREDLRGQTVEIGGPAYWTYDEMVALVAQTLKLRRWKLHLPLGFMRPLVGAMEKTLPRPPATLQQLSMLAIDNTADLTAVERAFGFRPHPLEESVGYIGRVSWWDGVCISFGFPPRWLRGR